MEVNQELQGMKTHPVPSQPRYFYGKDVGIKAGVKQNAHLHSKHHRMAGSTAL
ncbi:hypothetical protein BKA83DRAFT_102129 [Pisolithus microcarpus]|nr:hypothetical protein BKA83DRAFT_102129 [Pisolithus microcarpus]